MGRCYLGGRCMNYNTWFCMFDCDECDEELVYDEWLDDDDDDW